MPHSIHLQSSVLDKYNDIAIVFAIADSHHYQNDDDSNNAAITVIDSLNRTFSSIAEITNHPYSDLYNTFYRSMGLKPKSVSTPIKQSARIFETKYYRPILPVVDACMAIEYISFLSFQVYDLDSIADGMRYRFATGTEPLINFHGESKICKKDELILEDDNCVIHSAYYGNHQSKMLTRRSRYALIRIMKIPGIASSELSSALTTLHNHVNIISSIHISSDSPSASLPDPYFSATG